MHPLLARHMPSTRGHFKPVYMIISFTRISQASLDTLPPTYVWFLFILFYFSLLGIHTAFTLTGLFVPISAILCQVFPNAHWSYHRELINLSLLQVTQDPRVVLPLRWDELVEDEGADLQLVFSSMAKQIQSLLAQRDTHLEVHVHVYPYCSHTWVKVKILG